MHECMGVVSGWGQALPWLALKAILASLALVNCLSSR